MGPPLMGRPLPDGTHQGEDAHDPNRVHTIVVVQLARLHRHEQHLVHDPNRLARDESNKVEMRLVEAVDALLMPQETWIA